VAFARDARANGLGRWLQRSHMTLRYRPMIMAAMSHPTVSCGAGASDATRD
jgi:hypothetical protein